MKTTTVKTVNAIELLTKFANKKPCLEFRDYCKGYHDRDGRAAYFRESREITKDLHDFRELMYLLNSVYYLHELNELLIKKLSDQNQRLFFNGNKLMYCVGQYFPTEYRPAVNRVLASCLWAYYSNQYETGTQIRAKIKSIASARLYKNYFA